MFSAEDCIFKFPNPFQDLFTWVQDTHLTTFPPSSYRLIRNQSLFFGTLLNASMHTTARVRSNRKSYQTTTYDPTGLLAAPPKRNGCGAYDTGLLLRWKFLMKLALTDEPNILTLIHDLFTRLFSPLKSMLWQIFGARRARLKKKAHPHKIFFTRRNKDGIRTDADEAEAHPVLFACG